MFVTLFRIRDLMFDRNVIKIMYVDIAMCVNYIDNIDCTLHVYAL